MDMVQQAQDLVNLGVAVYAMIALMLLGMLVLLGVGIAVIERHGTSVERRRAARRPASYGATRRRVLAPR